ncbi:MAG: outer membrane lipoprotein carrier protein LolA [Pseudomonadota bacterium]
MKLISSIIAIVIITALCAHASAKDNSIPKERIDAIEAAYSGCNDLTADFTQTTQIALLERTVKKDGVFQFKRGGMMRIEYKNKNAKHYVSDGSTLWTYIPGDEGSLETFAVNDKTIPKEALSFLNGFGKLTKEFEVSNSTAFDKIPKEGAALHLIPRKKEPLYKSLDALFGADNFLTELIVYNVSGNVSRYVFSNITKNSGLSDDHFTLSSGKATPDTLPE